MPQRLEHNGSQPAHDEIAQRAREIYERSGCTPGRDLENWLEAESQILAARKTERERREPREHRTQTAEPRTASRALAKTAQRL